MRAMIPTVVAPYRGLSSDAARRFMMTICLGSITGPMNFTMLTVNGDAAVSASRLRGA